MVQANQVNKCSHEALLLIEYPTIQRNNEVCPLLSVIHTACLNEWAESTSCWFRYQQTHLPIPVAKNGCEYHHGGPTYLGVPSPPHGAAWLMLQIDGLVLVCSFSSCYVFFRYFLPYLNKLTSFCVTSVSINSDCFLCMYIQFYIEYIK